MPGSFNIRDAKINKIGIIRLNSWSPYRRESAFTNEIIKKQDNYKKLWYKSYEENERGIVIANHGREIICEHKFVTHHEMGENISGQWD